MGDKPVLVPFGKYKGQPVESLLADRSYLEWVMAQPGLVQMLQARHAALFNIITIGAPETDDTPEHNRLQARFLDIAFQQAFITVLTGHKSFAEYRDKVIAVRARAVEAEIAARIDRITKVEQEAHKKCIEARAENREWSTVKDPDSGVSRYVKNIEQFLQEATAGLAEAKKLTLDDFPQPRHVIHVSFERGYDVEFYLAWLVGDRIGTDYISDPRWPWDGMRWALRHVVAGVEVKPQMGDDFPSVLRQMRRNGATVLYCGAFDARGATLEQVRQMFGNLKIVMASDVEGLLEADGDATPVTRAAERARRPLGATSRTRRGGKGPRR
jgi:hypothetical protein